MAVKICVFNDTTNLLDVVSPVSTGPASGAGVFVTTNSSGLIDVSLLDTSGVGAYPGVTSDGGSGLNIGGAVVAGGAMHFTSTATIDGATRLNSTLQVYGTSLFAADTEIDANLVVQGDASVSGHIRLYDSWSSVGSGVIEGDLSTTAGVESLGAVCSNVMLSAPLVQGTLVPCQRTISGTYTVSGEEGVLFFDASGGAFTATLPSVGVHTIFANFPASTLVPTPPPNPTNTLGTRITLKKVDSSGNAVTIAAANGQTIDGQATLSLDAQYDYVVLQSNNSNWLVVGRGSSASNSLITGSLQKANNLSDLLSISTARTNLGLAPVAATGAYGDLTGKPTLATVATTGAYSDLTGKPTLATVATSGAYNDLTGKPSLATVATTGAYNDLTGKPTLATVATTGAYSDLIGSPTLAAVATSGAYSDLSGRPTLATVATTGAYSDLSGTPTLATVATTGSYNDLSNKPTIPNYCINDTPAGTIDNVNTTFTLSYTPVAGKLMLFQDHQLLIEGTDYTVSSATITFTVAPNNGSVIRAIYQY